MTKKLQDKKGFTLAELLIVVAIIAVLVAISIPIFTRQLEKSREAVDLANVRAAYAEVMSAALTDDGEALYSVDNTTKIKQGDGTFKLSVKLTQQEPGWQMDTTNATIAGISITGNPTKGGACEVKYDPAAAASNNKVTLAWS